MVDDGECATIIFVFAFSVGVWCNGCYGMGNGKVKSWLQVLLELWQLRICEIFCYIAHFCHRPRRLNIALA